VNLLLFVRFELPIDDEPADGLVGDPEIRGGILDVDVSSRKARRVLGNELKDYEVPLHDPERLSH
jgi:hypothetical protein